MMRSNPKITRVQLKVNQNNESVLIGLVSAEPDYKLSLTLNRILKISLKNSVPVVLTDGSGSEVTFSRFSDNNSAHGPSFDLIANRTEKSCLIKKLKNIDYFFRIHNPENKTAADRILNSLRKTETVTAVLNIDIKSFKDKNLHLITE